jgi:hypothetical protein
VIWQSKITSIRSVNSQTFFTPETPWDFSKNFFQGYQRTFGVNLRNISKPCHQFRLCMCQEGVNEIAHRAFREILGQHIG